MNWKPAAWKLYSTKNKKCWLTMIRFMMMNHWIIVHESWVMSHETWILNNEYESEFESINHLTWCSSFCYWFPRLKAHSYHITMFNHSVYLLHSGCSGFMIHISWSSHVMGHSWVKSQKSKVKVMNNDSTSNGSWFLSRVMIHDSWSMVMLLKDASGMVWYVCLDQIYFIIIYIVKKKVI